MGDVVNFVQAHRPDQVFTCECGGQQFLLLQGGKVRCVHCNHIHYKTRWEYPDEE